MATVAGLFNTEQEAEQAIQALRSSGIEASNIGIVAQDRTRMESLSASTGAETGAAAASGAVGGAVLGGGLGLILGAIGAVAIPVVGPIIAAGPLVAALTGAGVGAATGGLVGVLTKAGIPQDEAEVYHTGVERGGILVTALTQNGQESTAREIMGQYGSLEPANARTRFERDPNYRLGQVQGNRGGTGEALGGGAGAVTGGVIGAVVGGPVGAAAGAAIGGAAGAGAGHVVRTDEGSSLGPMSGGAGGAVVGGVVGSVGGPLGTAAGAAIGSAVGGLTGEKATEVGAETVGNMQPTTSERVFSTGDLNVARNATVANTGAENAVEGAGVYSRNDAEDVVRNTSGNIRSEAEIRDTTADDVMDEGIEQADTMYKRQNIGL